MLPFDFEILVAPRHIDVSRFDGTMARDIRPGEVVTVFGTAENGKPFTAVGFDRTEPGRSPHNR